MKHLLTFISAVLTAIIATKVAPVVDLAALGYLTERVWPAAHMYLSNLSTDDAYTIIVAIADVWVVIVFTFFLIALHMRNKEGLPVDQYWKESALEGSITGRQRYRHVCPDPSTEVEMLTSE